MWKNNKGIHEESVTSTFNLLLMRMQAEMLFCSTVVGLPFLIPPMLVTGELFKAWASCSKVTVENVFFSPPQNCTVLVLKDPADFSCSIHTFMACWCLKPWPRLLAKFQSSPSLPSLVLPPLPWYLRYSHKLFPCSIYINLFQNEILCGLINSIHFAVPLKSSINVLCN